MGAEFTRALLPLIVAQMLVRLASRLLDRKLYGSVRTPVRFIMPYSIVERGQPNSVDYRVYIRKSEEQIVTWIKYRTV